MNVSTLVDDITELRSLQFIYAELFDVTSLRLLQEELDDLGIRSIECGVRSTRLLIYAPHGSINDLISTSRWGKELKGSLGNYWNNSAPDVPMSTGSLKFQNALIMGILNVTPDSFSDGGRFFDKDAAVKRALEMEEEGAAVLDLGGESTRPYSMPVSSEEELERVIPVLKEVAPSLTIPISIDTTKASVAQKALECGASIINDTSGLQNEEMIKVAIEHEAPVILMHSTGDPLTMQTKIRYDEVVGDISVFLHQRIEKARQCGLGEDKVIIDPGLGFGKAIDHNLEIIRRLRELRCLGRPILVGASRKGFIGKLMNAPQESRLEGSLAAASASLLNGANIVRAHDVREHVRLAKICDALLHF